MYSKIIRDKKESIEDYASSVWRLSANTKKVDVVLNNTVRIIATNLEKIQILNRISPPDIRWEVAAMVDRKKQINYRKTPCLEKLKFTVD